jgi:hypothetical protein
MDGPDQKCVYVHQLRMCIGYIAQQYTPPYIGWGGLFVENDETRQDTSIYVSEKTQGVLTYEI